MILADTSVWIDHLRKLNHKFADLLNNGRILVHPFVIGELAMGSLLSRDETLARLIRLPKIVAARHNEVLRFIEQRKLFGMGIGFVDAHLLASVQLTQDASLWTHDRRLYTAAAQLGLNF